VTAIPGDLLLTGFSQWIQRFRDCIPPNNDYVE
jgi:hypothetical protein